MMNFYCVLIVPIVWVVLGYSLSQVPFENDFLGGFDAVQHEGVEATEEVVLEGNLGERIAEHHPDDGHDQHAVEVHHQHVEDIAGAVHTSIEEGQAGGHEQHESG
ncbi:MAG: hypothetical protein ACKOBT_04475 [Actinomycetota bacterium]